MRALVTGGGGFLGRAIVKRLLERGDSVRVLGRCDYPDLERMGAQCVKGDIADATIVQTACAGMEVVFHAAAKVGLWGRYGEYYKANVEGTRHLLRACQDEGVSRLVFTGSPSVVFDGREVEGWDERAPYARRYDSHYSHTKAVAEEMVLAANGRGLATVSLRPHLIWGPGDNHIVPRLIAQAKAGRLRRIGRDDKLVDTTYIDDAAEAHLLAANRLLVSPSIGGRVYFISSGEPWPQWRIINGILAAAGVPPVERSMPKPLAHAAAFACEAAWRLLGREDEPPLTRFVVRNLTTAHWFDISAARRDLGYAPKVSIEEGLWRLKLSLKP